MANAKMANIYDPNGQHLLLFTHRKLEMPTFYGGRQGFPKTCSPSTATAEVVVMLAMTALTCNT